MEYFILLLRNTSNFILVIPPKSHCSVVQVRASQVLKLSSTLRHCAASIDTAQGSLLFQAPVVLHVLLEGRAVVESLLSMADAQAAEGKDLCPLCLVPMVL